MTTKYLLESIWYLKVSLSGETQSNGTLCRCWCNIKSEMLQQLVSSYQILWRAFGCRMHSKRSIRHVRRMTTKRDKQRKKGDFFLEKNTKPDFWDLIRGSNLELSSLKAVSAGWRNNWTIRALKVRLRLRKSSFYMAVYQKWWQGWMTKFNRLLNLPISSLYITDKLTATATSV